MNKIVSYDGIGYEAATFEVNADTQAILKASFLNAKTGNVDINEKRLAVTLDATGKVGFGSATALATEPLFGVIMAYEQDGFASVQTGGYVEGVPTLTTLAGAVKTLAVNDAGKVASIALTVSGAEVIVPATDDSPYATIKL